MNNISDIPVAVVAGPRCGSATIINYFVEVHGYKFEYCDVPVYKPKTIYLLREIANFDYINSNNYQKMNKWMHKFIKLANNDQIHTIALIRDPIQQLLSIYHKTIENGGKFENIKLPLSTTINQFICYRRYNGIIYDTMCDCKDIIDIEELSKDTKHLNFKLITIKEASGNRGIEEFIKYNLLSSKLYELVLKSESNKIYRLLTKQQSTKPF